MFIIVNNIGLTVNEGQITVHLCQKTDLRNWFNQESHSFSGSISNNNFLRRMFRSMKEGDKVRIKTESGFLPRTYRVDAIFTTPNIRSIVTPDSLIPILWETFEEKDLLERIPFIHTVKEFCYYTTILKAAFTRALINGSYTVPLTEIFQECRNVIDSMESLSFWLKDISNAGLISINRDLLTIEDPLVYLMIHRINQQRPFAEPMKF